MNSDLNIKNMSSLRRRTSMAVFVFLLINLVSQLSYAQTVAADPYKNTIAPKTIKAFYDDRQGQLFWHGGLFGLGSDANYFIQSLKDSWQHGLNPDQFRLHDIELLRGKTSDSINQTALDITLTDAYIRYVRALSGMRVSARELNLDAKDWLQPYTVKQTLKILPNIKSFRDLGDQIVPQSKTYKRLQAELIRLHNKPEELAQSRPAIQYSGKALRPGQVNKIMPDVRFRLGLTTQTTNQNLYDDRLAGAVMKFQREHGLKPDGYIGGQTLHMLNQGAREQFEQLVANLERLRWKPEAGAKRYIIVNIPSATLWAIENERTTFEMPVVVGRKKRETQPFIAFIEGVRINPDWTLPPTVKKEDILPKLIEDPEYLINRGIKVYANYDGKTEAIDAATFDWSSVSENDVHAMRMVQPPSSSNPLGQYRVLMPNKYNIYLHDTNNKSAFDRATRGISSGCVRMSEPRKVTDFIFKDSQWSPEKLDSILEMGKKRDLMIKNPMPVFLLYQTIWIDYQGRVVYGNDIYDRDKALINSLKRLDGYKVPLHT